MEGLEFGIEKGFKGGMLGVWDFGGFEGGGGRVDEFLKMVGLGLFFFVLRGEVYVFGGVMLVYMGWMCDLGVFICFFCVLEV